MNNVNHLLAKSKVPSIYPTHVILSPVFNHFHFRRLVSESSAVFTVHLPRNNKMYDIFEIFDNQSQVRGKFWTELAFCKSRTFCYYGKSVRGKLGLG